MKQNIILLKIFLCGLFFIFIFNNGAYSQTCTLCPTCDSTLRGVINGNVTVPAFKTWCADTTAVLNGTLTVSSQSKFCNSGTINGNLVISGISSLCNEGTISTNNIN
ncbi:MAG: hypothetical protein PHD97_11940, partial [Bacteroidales bacterium]|nr:hypothetical protein [Bacteroidales bacterium]